LPGRNTLAYFASSSKAPKKSFKALPPERSTACVSGSYPWTAWGQRQTQSWKSVQKSFWDSLGITSV